MPKSKYFINKEINDCYDELTRLIDKEFEKREQSTGIKNNYIVSLFIDRLGIVGDRVLIGEMRTAIIHDENKNVGY